MFESKRQEKRLAKKIKGKRCPASGAFPLFKSDVVSGRFRGEAKYTAKRSFSIKLSDWEKIRSEAIRSGREPFMAIEIAGTKLILVSENFFMELVNE